MKDIKVLRLLIILEMMSLRNKRMKFTLIGYAKLVPKVLSFLTLVFICYGFFAIILAKCYSGRFWHCVNYVEEAVILDKHDCFNWGGDWI